MNNPSELLKPPTDGPRDIISPEGLDERVEFEHTFRVTLTQGGKFRTYDISDTRTKSDSIHDTKDEAMKSIGFSMAMLGSLLIDPKRTIEIVLNSFKTKEAGDG